MIVELRSVPDCPNLDATRSTLAACLAEAGLTVPIIERVGDYRSPSILINGADVTGADPSGPPACMLRPPTAAQIRRAGRCTWRRKPRRWWWSRAGSRWCYSSVQE
ncbi:hypothetical protein KRMM14A1259_57740 [Krasilnikovia sp. MM14-A1259]